MIISHKKKTSLKKKIKIGLLAWTSQYLKTSFETPLKIIVYTYYKFI